MRTRIKYPTAATRAAHGSGRHLNNHVFARGLASKDIVTIATSLTRDLLGARTKGLEGGLPQTFPIHSPPHFVEALLAATPLPLIETGANEIKASLSAKLSRDGNSADISLVERRAGIDVAAQARALERLRSANGQAIDLATAPAPLRAVAATQAKIQATQFARMRVAYVRQLQLQPFPGPLCGGTEWIRVGDVHQQMLVGPARALHAILGTERRSDEPIGPLMDRLVGRGLIPRKAAPRLVEMALKVLPATGWEDREADTLADALTRFVLDHSWALASYRPGNDSKALGPALTFVDWRLGVSAITAVVLIAMNLAAAWHWIDRWLDAPGGQCPEFEHAVLVRTGFKRSYSKRSIIELTDYLRCDGRSDRDALRESGRGDGNQSKRAVVIATCSFAKEFPDYAQSVLAIDPSAWLVATAKSPACPQTVSSAGGIWVGDGSFAALAVQEASALRGPRVRRGATAQARGRGKGDCVTPRPRGGETDPGNANDGRRLSAVGSAVPHSKGRKNT